VPPKRPEGRQGRLSDDVLVLSDNLLGSAFEHEVDFKLASNRDVAEDSLASIVVLNNWRHSVGVTEVNSDELAFVLCLNEGERVHTVGLLSSLAVVVGVLLAIRPHGPGSF